MRFVFEIKISDDTIRVTGRLFREMGLSVQSVCVPAAFLVFGISSHAATVSWNTAATTSSWTLGSNWVGGVAPVNGDDVSLDSSGTNDATGLDIAGLTLNSITFSAGGALTIGSTAFTLASGGSLVNATSGLAQISSAIALLGNATVNSSGTSNMSLSGVISGAGNITIQGAAVARTITTGVNHTFTGNWLINSGTLVAGSDTRLGNAANDLVFGGGRFRVSNMTLGAGRVLDFSGGNGEVQISSAAGAALQLNAAGQLVGGNTLTYIGSSNTTNATTLSIGAANTGFTGSVVMSAINATDVVDLKDANSLGQTGSKGSITLTKGTLNLTSDTSTTFGNNTTASALASGDTTIAVERATAGAGVSHTLGTLSIGTKPLTVTKGANVTSGTAGLIFGATTLTGNPTFTLTNANLSLGDISTGDQNRRMTVASGSTGQLHFVGNVAPSTSAKNLTFDNAATSLAGSTTFDTGSTFTFNLGTSSDNISLWNYESGEVVFNSNTITVNQATGFTTTTYTLFNFYSDSGTTLTAHGLSSGLGTVTIAGGGFNGAIVYNTNTIDLVVSAIPEPSTYLFMILGGLMLLVMGCRRTNV